MRVTGIDKMKLSTAVIVIGIAIVLLFGFADGIGIGDFPGVGRVQAIGSVAGIFVVAVGLYLRAKAI